MFRAGQLPCPSTQFATGTIIVYPDAAAGPGKVALYARVSSHDQKADLVRQMERLRQFAAGKGLQVSKECGEVGSGLNGRRKQLLALLEDSTVGVIVVENRDRLARFGFDYLEAALSAAGRQIMVASDVDVATDLVQDFVDVVTSMCARIYGKRSAGNRAKRAVEAASRED